MLMALETQCRVSAARPTPRRRAAAAARCAAAPPPPSRREALGAAAPPPPSRREALGAAAPPPPSRREALGAAAPPPPSRREALGAAALAAAAALLAPRPAAARLEGVNKPELLPPGPPRLVLDPAGFLTPGQEERLGARAAALEADTGVRLRVLAQNYPDTPGLAVRDYWAVDADTVVLVADPSTGNVLNFNVGDNVDLRVPRNFWTRLTSRFGTRKYWQALGPDVSIVNAVAAIDACLREPAGRLQCAQLRGELEE